MYRFTEKFYSDYPNAIDKVGAGTGNMIVSNIFEKLDEVFQRENEKNDNTKLCIIGRIKNRREKRFINSEYVSPNKFLNKYNVMVAEANGNGNFGEVLSQPFISYPNEGATDTFISLGFFETEQEAEACLKYVKSKFARTMLGILKVTQHNPRATWRYVPLQDFTENSDIDWSESIHGIDLQLYEKYGLDEKEIEFIETHVKEMA